MTTSIRTDGAPGRPMDAGPRATFTGSIRIKLRTPAKLRNLELGLLLFAVVLGAGAIMLVEFGAIGRLDPGFFVLCLPLVILVAVIHVALRLVAPDADPFVFPIAVLLNGIGIAMIHRIDIARHAEGLGGVRRAPDRLDHHRLGARPAGAARRAQPPRAAALSLRRDVRRRRAAAAAARARPRPHGQRGERVDRRRPVLVPAR